METHLLAERLFQATDLDGSSSDSTTAPAVLCQEDDGRMMWEDEGGERGRGQRAGQRDKQMDLEPLCFYI